MSSAEGSQGTAGSTLYHEQEGAEFQRPVVACLALKLDLKKVPGYGSCFDSGESVSPPAKDDLKISYDRRCPESEYGEPQEASNSIENKTQERKRQSKGRQTFGAKLKRFLKGEKQAPPISPH